jgi:dTDP-4-dehydrorhamnose reductase
MTTSENKEKNKNIVILGADGFVGRLTYLYLSLLFPANVWGTTRNKKEISQTIFYFSAEEYQKHFEILFKKINTIDFVINCIGNVHYQSPHKDLIYANALFPHLLEELAETYEFKLIHISTDAIFSPLSGRVNEKSIPSPIDIYGMSKLLGETASENAITIRTSFIGLDPKKQRGLFENILKNKSEIVGFTNQFWTGCTTLQFAKLCAEIIRKNKFDKLRKHSNVLHFAPLGPISKYTMIKTFLKEQGYKFVLKKTKGEKRKRILTTNLFDLLALRQYTSNIRDAIKEVIAFENIHGKK